MSDHRLTYDLPAPSRRAAGIVCDACGTELECVGGLGVLGVGQMFTCHVCPWTSLEPRKPPRTAVEILKNPPTPPVLR